MAAYYANLIIKAFLSIPGSLGSNWLGLVFPAIVVLVGEGIACVVYGWSVMVAKWKQATLLGFASLGVCYLLLFAWCAIYQNYFSISSLQVRADTLQSSVDAAGTDKRIAVLSAQNECAQILGKNEILTNQNRDQQNTINNCQTQALRLIADTQSLKITDYFLGLVPSQYNQNIHGKYHGTFLVLTNKPVSPIRLLVSCDAEIEVSGDILGTGSAMSGGWGGRVTGSLKQYGFGLLSPAWTPVNPLLLTVYTDSPSLGRCTFDER